MLSHRGQAAVSQPLRADLDLFFEAMDNRYDAQDNPDGVFTLCVAENLLNWAEMEAKLREIAGRPIPEWVPAYTAIAGAPELRESAAAFLERHVSGVVHNPERLYCGAGAARIIELSSFMMGDPGDVVVIPGPAYMAYTPDIGNIPNLERYDLHPERGSLSSGEGGGRGQNSPSSAASSSAPHPAAAPYPTQYELTTADLDRAHAKLGDRFRVLLLTQPNNPTGQVYGEQQLEDIFRWCADRQIHLVVNEIYALSLLDTSHPDLTADYPEPVPFATVLPLLEREKSPYLHWWYAISKDFGLSGLRLGLGYTYNEDLVKAWGNYGSTGMTSNHTQWLLSEVFTDHEWVAEFVVRNQRRLTENYATVIRTLRDYNIPYAPARGSLFVWLDLSRYLAAATEEAELDLWREVYDETGILLTSPVGTGADRRGWYRMVYSCVSREALGVAMDRFGGWLDAKA